jgi:hypothetical protein
VGELGLFGVVFHLLESGADIRHQIHLPGGHVGGRIQHGAQFVDGVNRRVAEGHPQAGDCHKT